MSSKIRIETPEDDSDIAGLIILFQERVTELAPALDCDVADFDERARIDEIHIRAVDIEGDSIAITYELLFSAFYACSDIDYAGHHQRVVSGRREGDLWVFSPHVSLPPRSTLDEL